MSDKNYYSTTDKWIMEENNGKSIPWIVIEFDKCNTISVIGLHKGVNIYFDLEERKGKILYVFESNSTIDAMQKYYTFMEYGKYHPHLNWDIKKGCWKDED